MKHITRLSSQLFLILHDPFTGRGEVSQELLEYGVAAAQLADLIIAQRLRVGGDQLMLGPSRPPADAPPDDVDDYVVGNVAEQQKTYSVRMWLGSLGEAITDLVVAELVESRIIRHDQRRGFRGRRLDRFPAADLLRASSARNNVRNMLVHPEQFDLAGATLALIVGTLGADHVFEVPDTQPVLAELNTYMAPPLQALVAALATAVAAASVALGGRR